MRLPFKFRLVAVALVLTASPVIPIADENETELAASRTLIQSYSTRLKAALVSALKEGGPAVALRVCQEQAPKIAADLSRESGAKVSRISRRFRNPESSPEPWQTAVLEEFERRLSDNSVLESFESHAAGARYLQGIRMQPMCLQCHGDDLQDEVVRVLDERYPADRARGYSVGDLRGAFSVQWPKAEE